MFPRTVIYEQYNEMWVKGLCIGRRKNGSFVILEGFDSLEKISTEGSTHFINTKEIIEIEPVVKLSKDLIKKEFGVDNFEIVD